LTKQNKKTTQKLRNHNQRRPKVSAIKGLNGFGWKAKEHLKENRPKMYQQLKESGRLEKYLMSVQKEVSKEIAQRMDNGAQWHEAWEYARQRIYIPSEDEEPIIGVTTE
jgi:hypothetical protein